MTSFTRRGALATIAAAPFAGSARAAPPGAPPLVASFSETFAGKVDFYEPIRKSGRWKTNYWFGDQRSASSRSLPAEKQIYVDQGFAGVDPFVQDRTGLRIIAARNARPEDGRLLTPYGDRKSSLPYTSGLITTETSFNQLYGYFEATLTFPRTRGCWPAFWMLGPPHGPGAGDEIDIVEWVASNPRRLFFNAHAEGKANAVWVDGYDTSKPTTYGLLWTREALAWYVNGALVHKRANPGLHRPMYLLLNLAVGGWDNNLPEDPGGFPAALHISAVRAWRLA